MCLRLLSIDLDMFETLTLFFSSGAVSEAVGSGGITAPCDS